MNDLKPCPYCGKTTVECMSSEEIHETKQYGESFAVCCNYQDGGCGATGGFRETEEEAIEVWNRRVDDAQEQK